MYKLNTTSVSLAVTPTVVSTLFSHYLNRKPLKERPTAHLSYDEGLHLVRSFLDFASHHTVEELQAFTSQWVPTPQWVKVETVTIPAEHMSESASLLEEQLGPEGIRQVGGTKWWQWRNPKSELEAEWIEMKAHANERKKKGKPCRRVMLYIHGGAYFFGSVDEHRYQMQRHARKLRARVFAPKYRLSPQFPFPCGLQDCLAAYLYLLTVQDPSTIIIAGDSAGGGMAVSLLCILRDQGIPLPAGGILISPWVDLTHSFPSVAGDAPFDYIPQCGFHHKPSRSWPPPNAGDVRMLRDEAEKAKGKKNSVPGTNEMKAKQAAIAKGNPESNGNDINPDENAGSMTVHPDDSLTVMINGKPVVVKDQIQMYTTNSLLNHPLVSPVMQPSLGGLPPLSIMVGGGEILRDEQVYLAHKCAYPSKYPLAPEFMTDKAKSVLGKYKPTDVQLQVWDDLCHVAPTLSFTRPAKYMYRSVAQFGAWALARAQHRGIDILDDDDISVISKSGSEDNDAEEQDEGGATENKKRETLQADKVEQGTVGKAGDPLPPFKNHMIRQRVTRKGVTLTLAPESELPGCCMKVEDIGVPKQGPVKKWIDTRQLWDTRFATTKARVHKKIVKDMATGYREFGAGEYPPPSALAGRRKLDEDFKPKIRRKSMGLALWSLWGSKHDEDAVQREKDLDDESKVTAVDSQEGLGARPFEEIQDQEPATDPTATADATSRSRSRRRTVRDLNQTGSLLIDENTPIADLLAMRTEQSKAPADTLSPSYVPPTGAAGKRPHVDGIAMPFSLGKEADTASMVTLQSGTSQPPTTRALSPEDSTSKEKLESESKLEEAGS